MIYHRFQGRFHCSTPFSIPKFGKKRFFPCRPGNPPKQKKMVIYSVPCAKIPYVWLLEAPVPKFPEIWEQKLFFCALSWEIHFPQHLYPEAESWRGPFDDCREMVSLEKDYSKPAGHHCTWCFQSPNNCTEQNDPCVVQIVAVPKSQAEHLSEYSI